MALDEGVPEDVIGYLPGHDVKSVRMLGLKGVKNGMLLTAIAAGEFEAFITNDKRMEAEGQLRHRPFAVVILSATNWKVIKPYVGRIAAALETAKPGAVAHVDVGQFRPVKRKYQQGP